MTTLKEIAELAHVSYATVSHVLNGRTHKMSPETLERIQRILKEKNYVPNMTGRALAKYGSKIISIVRFYPQREVLNPIIDPFFSELLGVLEEEISRRGYYVMLQIASNVEENIRKSYSWNAEGLIVTGGTPAECRRFVELVDVPLVFIDGYFDDTDSPYVNVGIEDRQGGYMIAKHLLEQGHRDIAFLAHHETLWGAEKQRFLGCKDALAELGLEFTPENNYIRLSYLQDERREELWKLLWDKPQRFSALFFNSDLLASDALCFCLDEGLRVPEDISICGFDDSQHASLVRPKLTTVRQDVGAKARGGVDQLFALIEQKGCKSQDIRLPVSLSIRGSVAKHPIPVLR